MSLLAEIGESFPADVYLIFFTFFADILQIYLAIAAAGTSVL